MPLTCRHARGLRELSRPAVRPRDTVRMADSDFARQTPGGRAPRPATVTLSAAILTGGLGSGELGVDSAAERLRRAARGQRTSVKAVESTPVGA